MGLISSFRLEDRFYSVASFPEEFGFRAGAGISGVIFGLGATLMLGTNKMLNHEMSRRLSEFEKVISTVYHSVLGVINPSASADLLLVKNEVNSPSLTFSPTISSQLWKVTYYFLDSSNFVSRNIFGRVSIALVLVGTVAAKVADIALGIIVASVSLVFFGSFSQLNLFAFDHLQAAPSLVFDIFEATIMMINPNAQFT